MRIIVIGSNPAEASPDTTAFHPNTRSRTILERWFINIDADISYANIRDQKTSNNRPLRVSEIKNYLPWVLRKTDGYDKIVALGKTAAKALSMLQVEYFEAPHPSGLNRKLNCPIYVEQMIKSLEEYIGGETLHT